MHNFPISGLQFQKFPLIIPIEEKIRFGGKGFAMILTINELCKIDFQLSKINIFHQKPRYRKLQVKHRGATSFLFILHGHCTYFFDGSSFELVPGSVVYLPYGSTHDLEVHSEVFEFHRIDFQLTVDNEIVLFSNAPQKMCHVAPNECMEAVQALLTHCQFVHNSIRKTELMCTIFRTLATKPANARRERLSPAIQYLLEHLTDKIDCSYLAQVCSLGSAQFYNLFREEYHVTPLEYRDNILMNRAVILLENGAFSVAEVAEMLGFESVSYFSRFFKKHRGVSPSKLLGSV